MVNSIAFSPVVAHWQVKWRSYIRLWHSFFGTNIRTLTGHKDIHGHTTGVDSIAFSPDGIMLASGSSVDRDVGCGRSPVENLYTPLPGTMVVSVVYRSVPMATH